MAKRAAESVLQRKARCQESALERLIGYHLRRASLMDLTGVTSNLGTANIRAVPFSVFTLIVENPGITAAQICRQLTIQRANIVPILADLEARGLFVRGVNLKDQRIQPLYPTKAGLSAHGDWLARLAAHEQHLLRRLTQVEREILRELLERIWKED